MMTRREFLKGATVAGVAVCLGVLPTQGDKHQPLPDIEFYTGHDHDGVNSALVDYSYAEFVDCQIRVMSQAMGMPPELIKQGVLA